MDNGRQVQGRHGPGYGFPAKPGLVRVLAAEPVPYQRLIYLLAVCSYSGLRCPRIVGGRGIERETVMPRVIWDSAETRHDTSATPWELNVGSWALPFTKSRQGAIWGLATALSFTVMGK